MSSSAQVSNADVQFSQGDFGDNYDFVVYNADGSLADLTGFVGGTNKLYIIDSNFANPPVLIANLTVIPTGSIARWVMGSSDTNYFGTFVAILYFIDPGNSVSRKTVPLSVFVYPGVPS